MVAACLLLDPFFYECRVWIKLGVIKDFCALCALSKGALQAGKEMCVLLLEQQLRSCLTAGDSPSCVSLIIERVCMCSVFGGAVFVALS